VVDFALTITSLIVSILGAVATVYFAIQASNSSDSAKQAADLSAQQTIRTIGIFSAATEIERLISALDSLRAAIDSEKWGDAARLASRMARSATALSAANIFDNDQGNRDDLISVAGEATALESKFLRPNDIDDEEKAQVIESTSSLARQCSRLAVIVKQTDDRIAR